MKISLSPTLTSWLFVVIAVGFALAANAVSAKWGDQKVLLNPLQNHYLIPMLVLSPLVFITFGLTAARTGLALGSASVDSLLTIVTIAFGLVFFREWKTISLTQWIGFGSIIIGIVLTQLPKAAA